MAASAARAIAAEGGAVFVVSRTAAHLEALAREIEAAGGTCGTHAADLRREDEVEAAFRAFDARLGRLDAVYSVAGISGRRFGDGPLHAATLEGWETVLATNATSQFLVARAAVTRMLAQEPDAGGSRGVVLLMSSVLARWPAAAHFGTHGYAASKGAIDGLTRSAAATYARDGIRVNAIAPSLVATPMSRRAQDDPAITGYLRAKQPLAGGPIDADAVTLGRAPPAVRREPDGHRAGDRGRRRLERQRARGARGGLIGHAGEHIGIRRRAYGVRAVPSGTVRVAHSLWAVAERTTVALTDTIEGSTSTMSRLRMAVAAALAFVLVLPATVLAATVDVGGTVTNLDGTPAVGAEIAILIQGSDTIVATTTDEAGAWALQLDAEPGATLEVNGTGVSTASEPDADGCITTTTPSGQTTATIPADGPVPAIDFPLDNLITGTACATATPPDTVAWGGGTGMAATAAARTSRPEPSRTRRASRRRRRIACSAAGATSPGTATLLVLGGAGVGDRARPGLRRPAGRHAAADRVPADSAGEAPDLQPAPATSIQPAPRVTRRTRRSVSSSTTCARRPAISRPRSSASRSAAGFEAAPATAAGSPPSRATLRTAVSRAMTEPASVSVPATIARPSRTSQSSPPIRPRRAADPASGSASEIRTGGPPASPAR